MASLVDIYQGVTLAMPDMPDGERCYFGPDNQYRSSSPPRIVWVPMGDTFGPPSTRGSSREDAIARHTARTPVDVHLWGDGWAGALDLRDRFIRAVRSFLGSNYHLGAGRWVGSEDLQSKGKLYVLGISFDIPVTDEPAQKAMGSVVVLDEDQTDTRIGA